MRPPLLVLCGVLALMSLAAHRAAAISVIPTIQVDLAAPPNLMWKNAVEAVLSQYSFEQSFALVFADHNASTFNQLPASAYSVIANATLTHYPTYAAELSGISSAFAAAG